MLEKTYNCYGKFLECSIHCQTMFWNLWQVFSHLCPSCAPDRLGIQWTFSNVACSAVSASLGTSCGSKRGQDHNFMIMGYGLWDFDCGQSLGDIGLDTFLLAWRAWSFETTQIRLAVQWKMAGKVWNHCFCLQRFDGTWRTAHRMPAVFLSQVSQLRHHPHHHDFDCGQSLGDIGLDTFLLAWRAWSFETTQILLAVQWKMAGKVWNHIYICFLIFNHQKKSLQYFCWCPHLSTIQTSTWLLQLYFHPSLQLGQASPLAFALTLGVPPWGSNGRQLQLELTATNEENLEYTDY